MNKEIFNKAQNLMDSITKAKQDVEELKEIVKWGTVRVTVRESCDRSSTARFECKGRYFRNILEVAINELEELEKEFGELGNE